jgi:hypothetical protein
MENSLAPTNPLGAPRTQLRSSSLRALLLPTQVR